MIPTRRPNSARERALNTIRAEVAEAGEVTRLAVRAYVENHVSLAAFHAAVREGMVWWERHPPPPEPGPLPGTSYIRARFLPGSFRIPTTDDDKRREIACAIRLRSGKVAVTYWGRTLELSPASRVLVRDEGG